jgi:hypothetical protein
MGLLGFSGTDVASGKNTGSIIIPSSQYSAFTTPNFIVSSSTTGVTASGSYGPLPYTTPTKIFGLTLGNKVYATGTAPGPWGAVLTGSTYWDGYFAVYAKNSTDTSFENQSQHVLNLGANNVGLNAVLRYQDYQGNWQVYSAFASNVAEPNGTVNIPEYDLYGITSGSTSQAGVYTDLWPTGNWPCRLVQSGTDNSWSQGGLSTPSNVETGAKNCAVNNAYYVMKADPRTARFGLSAGSGQTYVVPLNGYISDTSQNAGRGYAMNTWMPTSNSYQVSVDQNTPTMPHSSYPGLWAQNIIANGAGTFYYDNGPGGEQSGQVRPGDDFFTAVSGLAPSGTNNTYQLPAAQPVELNRPFRNVGELGYVFRDMPFKSLDMCSSQSVDAALLDFFTTDAALQPVVAGKVDVNTRQKQVLQCVLSGGFRVDDTTPNPSVVCMSSTVANSLAAAVTALTGTSPLLNKALLVTSQVLESGTTSDIISATANSVSPSIKAQREAPIRALGDLANSRTWNLLIDVIAQTGQYGSSASNLNQFVVTGERRYWLHVAIDRYTGMVVDEQLEPVYD